MDRIRVRISALLALTIASAGAYAAGTTLPSATVSVISTTSPVVRSTPAIAVSAMVTPTFDANSGPTTVQTACTSCSKGNNFCGSGNSAVKTQQGLTTTSIAVTNTTLLVRAAPEFGSSNPIIVEMTGGSAAGGAYTGSFPTPLSAVDGIRSVTVTGYVSEDVTTTTTLTTNNMSAASCGGSIITSTVAVPTSVTAKKFGTGSANGSYILDINAPGLTVKPVTSQPRVQQGGSKVIHNVLSNGSAKTNYTVVNTAAGPVGNTASAQGGDTFGPAGKGDGIAPDKHDMVSVHIPCNCAVGDYALDPIATVANTVDLLGNPFAPIPTATPDTFTVDPGLFLQSQTLVVSELPPVGDYSEMTCFSSTLGGSGTQRKVNLAPGSLHITATVKTTGPCSGFGMINNPKISLTLPAGFVFADTGSSPVAHVFVGNSAPGFDLHYPVTLTEVTGSIPKSAISANGPTVTVDLSSLKITSQSAGSVPGSIPSNYTIYVRAHAVPDPNLAAIPLDGTQYHFYTNVQADLPGIGTGLLAESYQDVTALPATAVPPAPVCVNGGVVSQQ